MNGLHLLANTLNDVQGIGVRQGPDTHENRRLTGKPYFLTIVLCSQHDIGDVCQTHKGAVLLADHQLPKFVDRLQVGVGGKVDLDQGTLSLAEGGQIVVGRQGLANLSRANVKGGHPFRLEPNAHGKGPGAEDVRTLHPFHRGQPGLDRSSQVVGDLVLQQYIG